MGILTRPMREITGSVGAEGTPWAGGAGVARRGIIGEGLLDGKLPTPSGKIMSSCPVGALQIGENALEPKSLGQEKVGETGGVGPHGDGSLKLVSPKRSWGECGGDKTY